MRIYSEKNLLAVTGLLKDMRILGKYDLAAQERSKSDTSRGACFIGPDYMKAIILTSEQRAVREAWKKKYFGATNKNN